MTEVLKKPFARSYAIRKPKADINIKRPRGAFLAYEPGDICAAYGWPTMVPVAPTTTVILELGGKFYPADVPIFAEKLAAKLGVSVESVTPKVAVYLLPGADDSPGDADGEVELDWQCAAQSYTCTTGLPANILLIYGPNSGQAFADIMNCANNPTVELLDLLQARNMPLIFSAGSQSWGSPEDGWSPLERANLDAAAQASPFPWMAASGDNLSNDGTSSPDTDLPASSPYVTGIGGTTFPTAGPETVWNNGRGEGTGGGFSKLYPRPDWQPVNNQGDGRMVPDMAVDADPNTGYDTIVNGSWQDIGGTSAGAPLCAGLLSAINGARLNAGLPMISQANPILWGLGDDFFDITNGNNGAFKATDGPDPCTGLGRPLGTLVSAMSGSGQIPPPSPCETAPSMSPRFSLPSREQILRWINTLVAILGPTALPIIEKYVASLGLDPVTVAAINALLEKLLGKTLVPA